MERIKHLFSSVENFVEALEKQGSHKVFSDIRADLDMQDGLCNNIIADKLCELQHDHTWIKQAVCNLIAMMKKDNVGYKPALLIGCNDKVLDAMFSDCYDKVRKMQDRIISLENEVRIMTEPKKGGSYVHSSDK